MTFDLILFTCSAHPGVRDAHQVLRKDGSYILIDTALKF